MDEIRLTVPARAPFARVARLAIAGVASRTGSTYDEVEDLRIAVGEAFGLLVPEDGPDLPPDATVTLRCTLHDDAIEVTAARSPHADLHAVPELSRLILDTSVDVVRIDAEEGSIGVTKRTEPSA